ncbi:MULTISPECIES: hypothetical protein [Niastella]|uniref:YARHG domain-containing protein n=1 Tax=Niastella soli TaxID=2821487 RepID=A0ABS3YM20_9BACT|nr:hypothetical protein [Niastella soli]MBO9198883.1 hypothetical protein [Niastella soli]
MKWFPLFTFFLNIFLQTKAQNDSLNQLFIKKHCGETHLNISPRFVTADEKIPSFFSNFEVLDLRHDTSRVGFTITSNSRNEFLFKESTSNALLNFFNRYAKPDGTKSFLILIKKFWLYDSVFSTGTSAYWARAGRVEFRGEAFLKIDNGYRPYTFLDTVITSPHSVKDMSIFRLSNLLYDFLGKIVHSDETATLKRNSYTIDELMTLNKKRFSYPMDTAMVLQSGVYANVEEFRNNRPSITNFEIKPDEDGLGQLYLKDESNDSYFSRKMFGYCDGKQCYVMMDGNLFPVLSVDHAFYVFGSREYKRKATRVPLVFLFPGMIVYGTYDVNEKISRKMHLFSLDPLSGKIY